MPVSVLKFGGSSLSDANKIRNVARIVQEHNKHSDTIVVLSAMQGETNRLLGLAKELVNAPSGRELDLLLTTGEQVSVSLLSLYLNSLSVPAIALDASRIKFIGSGQHQNALLKSVDCSIIRNYIKQGIVPVVTGFQVILASGEVATMERGGSDTSAVALAAAFSAKCYIYSDVDGVYSADPSEVSNAFHIAEISYDNMLSLSAVGAKVLQVRAIQLARKYKVPLVLRSTFSNARETIVKDLECDVSRFFGVAITKGRYIISINGRENFEKMSTLDIVFEEFCGTGDCYELIVDPHYLPILKAVFSKHLQVSPLLSKVSLVGVGAQNKARILSDVLSHLDGQASGIYSYRFNITSIDLWVLEPSASAIANIIHDLSVNNLERLL